MNTNGMSMLARIGPSHSQRRASWRSRVRGPVGISLIAAASRAPTSFIWAQARINEITNKM